MEKKKKKKRKKERKKEGNNAWSRWPLKYASKCLGRQLLKTQLI